MTYLPLKAGDIRQEGDETKWALSKHKDANEAYCSYTGFPKLSWMKIIPLLGQVILTADLITHSFRRPLP